MREREGGGEGMRERERERERDRVRQKLTQMLPERGRSKEAGYLKIANAPDRIA